MKSGMHHPDGMLWIRSARATARRARRGTCRWRRSPRRSWSISAAAAALHVAAPVNEWSGAPAASAQRRSGRCCTCAASLRDGHLHPAVGDCASSGGGSDRGHPDRSCALPIAAMTMMVRPRRLVLSAHRSVCARILARHRYLEPGLGLVRRRMDGLPRVHARRLLLLS